MAVMTVSPRRYRAAHDDSCAFRIRVLALHEAGDPPEPPQALLRAIAAQITACCGQTPLRAHRLAWGWSVAAVIEALHGVCAGDGTGQSGPSKRAYQDWEAGKHPARHSQDLLCRLFGTGPVQLGFARDYSEPEPGAAVQPGRDPHSASQSFESDSSPSNDCSS